VPDYPIPRDDMLLLYAPRHPITELSLREVGAFIDITFEICHRYAGSLRVRAEDSANFILQVLANTTRDVGYLSGGQVYWNIEPEPFGITSVIDQYGHIHYTTDLEQQ